jgi:hypothetical protein
MDLRLAAMIAIARVQLRQTIDELYPHLINEAMHMADIKRPVEIKRPMALAAFGSRLRRAEKSEADIEVTGKRYDLHGVGKAHVGQLEMYKNGLQATIERMVGGSNGGPTDGLDGQNSDGGAQAGQVISSKTEATPIATAALPPVNQVPATPVDQVNEPPAAASQATATLLPVNQVAPAPADQANETPAIDATAEVPPATGQA